MVPLKASGFAAYATRSADKDSRNQDSSIVYSNERYRLIAVADGVGMTANAAVASAAVVKAFPDYLDRAETIDRQIISGFYSYAIERIAKALDALGAPLNTAATTFIGVVETHDHVVVTYLADGAIYRITHSAEGYIMAATAELLTSASPDVPPQLGAGFLSDEPEIVEIAKQQPEGYMWIITTDGMNELDRYVDNGKRHVRGTAAAKALATEIWEAFRANPGVFSEKTIDGILLRWIKACQSTDDATIAVLISAEMHDHWVRLVSDNEEIVGETIPVSEREDP